MDLQRVENELKERWAYPYRWGRRQLNDWDKQTNFIYKTYSFNSLLEKIDNFEQPLKDYALNRWYNFWSAMAVEYIFSSHSNVIANKNKYDKLVDFSINNIPFDHKTSVFPRGFNRSYDYAKNNKKELIQWLYYNQSQEGRKHLKNRLFILLFAEDDEHWKLKAEINYLKAEINDYVINFNKNQLCRLDFGKGKIYSDIIWVVKTK